MICVLQIVFGEPVCVGFVQQGEVLELVAQFPAQIFALRERAKFCRSELMLLQFAEQPAQLPSEAGSAARFGGTILIRVRGA